MKKYLFLLVSLAIVTMTKAEDVTPGQALEEARSFIKNLDANNPMKNTSKAGRQLTMTRQVGGLYVFNVSGNGGFVVVSNDDRTKPILGYSDEGNFDPENIPENMRAWLQGYADEIDWLQQHDAKAAAGSRAPLRTDSRKSNISPLLTSKWNQDSPFNNLCPKYNGYSRCVTGCVATAMAQAMYYTEKKAGNTTTQTTAQIPAYTSSSYSLSLSAIPAGTTIDWGNMIDNYNSSYTTAQGTAVAQLMLYCGCSVQMDYGPSSGAFTDAVAIALKNYFDYNQTTQYVVRNYYTYSQWMDLIYHELSQGRPVVYGGMSSGGGHEFVCDGYKYEQSTDFFHINWGWGGTSDNYFVLSALDPDHQGIGGSTSNDGFHYAQDAVIGIQKSSDNGTVADILPNDVNLSLNYMTLSSNPIALGSTVTVTINITNNGSNTYDSDIYLGYSFNGEVYLVDVDEVNIPMGEARDCDIQFEPDQTGTYEMLLYILNADGYYYNIGGVGATLTVMSPINTPTDLVSSLTPGNGTVATLSWTETGTATTWQICLDGDMSNLITTNSNTYTLTGLTPEKTYTAKVRAVDGELASDWSNEISFKPTNDYILTVNNGSNSNSYVPVYGYWVDKTSKSQFIIPADDLNDMVNGTINGMTFYATQNTVNWGDAKFEVYVKEVDNTTLSSLEDWSNLTKVRNAGSLSIGGKQMIVEFDNDYQYMGGNLLVGILQTESGSWGSCNWLGVIATGASLGGYDTYISQQDFLPMTSFAFTPGVAPEYPKPAHLTLGEVTGHSATLSWTAPESENTVTGYAYQYKRADTETWSAETMVTETMVTIDGLTAMTNYNFRVKALYEGDNESEYLIKSFKTYYDAISLPYAYGFENASEMDYWTTVFSANTPEINSSEKKSGDNSFRFSSYSKADSYNQYLISPKFVSTKDVKVQFYYKAYSYGTETFKVGYSTTDTNLSSFTFGNEISTTAHSWTLYEETFPAGTKYVAVWYYSDYQYYLYVDDFSFTAVTKRIELANDDSGKPANGKNTNIIGTYAGQTVDVTLAGRTLYKDGQWNTICLPFDVTLDGSPLEGATAKTLADATMEGTRVALTFGDDVTTLVAGTPYIIKWENTEGAVIADPVFTDVLIVNSSEADRTISKAGGCVKFIGYYGAFDIDISDNDIYYMTSGNTLKHSGGDRRLTACRAYFQFSENTGGKNMQSPAKQIVLDFGEGETQGIEEANALLSTLPSSLSEWYTVDGKKLDKQPTRKGLYIHNGRKAVVK